jgi:hypothetical protein
MRTGIAVLTYHSWAVFGVTAAYEAVPEIDVFTSTITDELRALRSAAEKRSAVALASRRRIRLGGVHQRDRAPCRWIRAYPTELSSRLRTSPRCREPTTAMLAYADSSTSRWAGSRVWKTSWRTATCAYFSDHPARHYDHRTPRLGSYPHADRSHEEPGKSAEAARADHQQARRQRLGQQDPVGVADGRARARRDVGMAGQGSGPGVSHHPPRPLLRLGGLGRRTTARHRVRVHDA